MRIQGRAHLGGTPALPASRCSRKTAIRFVPESWSSRLAAARYLRVWDTDWSRVAPCSVPSRRTPSLSADCLACA